MTDAPRLFDFDYDERMPRFDAARWGYGPPKGTVAVAVGCVLLAAGSAGLLAGRGFLLGRTPDIARDRGGDDSALPPMRPPDRGQVQRAYELVRLLFTAQGVPGLVREGQTCFAAVERAPDYRRLDYCLAFDAFASAVWRVAGDQGSDASSYFTRAAVRHTRATDAVGANMAEAKTRIAAVGRLAAAISRENVKTAPLIVAPPPPEVEAPPEEAPSQAAPPAAAGEDTTYRAIGPQPDETGPATPEPAAPTPTPEDPLPPG